MAALALRAAVYEAREQMPVTDLTVITMGITARRLLISTKGDVLGIDCIIPDDRVALRENDHGDMDWYPAMVIGMVVSPTSHAPPPSPLRPLLVGHWFLTERLAVRIWRRSVTNHWRLLGSQGFW